jgi:hypothetical protein
MSYTEIQQIDAQGIPTIEYRAEPDEISIPSRIQFDFEPRFPHDQYGYSEPKYVFCEQVILVTQWQECQDNQYDFFDIYETYHICALELEEYSLTGKKLYEAPSWKYGIRGTKGTKELVWFEEDELISINEINSVDQEF